MKKIFLLVLLIGLVLTGCSVIDSSNLKNVISEAQTGHSDEGKDTLSATVIRTIDGDTFTATVNAKEEKIRLLLVDTPETKHPTKDVQPFGKEASAFTESLLTAGKTVQLEFDVAQRDLYGRLLAYVYVDGKMLNEMLLEKGYARRAVFPPNTKYVDEFGTLQENAKSAGVGIWSVENYTQEDKKN